MQALFGKRINQDEDLKMLDGLRVLCLIWVMTLGVCQFTMVSSTSNPWSLEDYFQTYAYTAVYSSNLGFDEFFLLSAMLLTIKLQKLLEQGEKMTPLKYLKLFAQRYWRMAPVYYLIFMFGW